MANISALVVTPSNSSDVYTFKPSGSPAPNIVDYFNDTGVPDGTTPTPPNLPAIGRPRIRVVTTAATASRNAKVSVQIDAPVLAVTSPSTASGVEPAATRAYNPICKVEFFVPRQAGDLSLNRMYDLARGLLDNVLVKSAVVDAEYPW